MNNKVLIDFQRVSDQFLQLLLRSLSNRDRKQSGRQRQGRLRLKN